MEFQEIFHTTCQKYVDEWIPDYGDDIKIGERGDEGLLMILRARAGANVSEEVDLAVNVAFDLKRKWLCSTQNRQRIDSGLLPVNLAIGIHAGKTYLTTKGPEGYAINLAKRVETHSREGSSTHIFVSEAANGHLNHLADEVTYLFDDPQTITPKGITQGIRVHEVKHQFLPSDWTETAADRKRAKTLLDHDAELVSTLEDALRINPTNLWLAEEFIRSSMLYRYSGLSESDRGDDAKLAEAFAPAKAQAELLAQGEQRDAGVLFIIGLIEGESADYNEERSRYSDAIQFSDQLAQAYWYRGQSFSYEVWDTLDKDVEVPYDDLPDENQKLVAEAIHDLGEARRRRPQCAWILCDYGCELVRWCRNKDERRAGIDNLVLAVDQLDGIREHLREEPYMSKVKNDPRIAKLLDGKRKASP